MGHKTEHVPNSDYCSCKKGEYGSIQNEPEQPMLYHANPSHSPMG